MGGVYRGQHVATGADVALKLLDGRWSDHDAIVARLVEEADLSQCVTHRGLLRVFEARSDAGQAYLVMELLRGENLAIWLESGRFGPMVTAEIGAQIACAVAALHNGGVVHCDLKPENVMILDDADGGREPGLIDEPAGWLHVKVIDYGVACRLNRGPGQIVVGTPAYMAPEQWRGYATSEVDVYNLGCLLHELVTGQVPFVGGIPDQIVAHLSLLPPVLSGTDPLTRTLDRWIKRMMAKDPALRPQMDEVARALSALAPDSHDWPSTQD
jgi:serine/threonine-protein kinase